jgi:osmotically-inducible protein OsmY
MRTLGILLTFVIGVVVGVVADRYMNQPRSNEMAVSARESVRDSANKVGDSLKETFDGDKIKDELARTGQVVREKTQKAGHAIADATLNARTTAAIKSKLVADEGLAAFKIDVDSNDGVVTLSGSVSSPDDIARAMKIALEQDGVNRVVSTLVVKPPTN